ncbi:unnamed protein product [Dracunculus medinensis]|uniref:DNA topoisomerase 2 n=1 Tax=Dracunculus medinensis TaxID=318479 RepID=A0A0N4U200_DRAME|nr:unnamed protein product [Dracunculus medinensis]
MHKKIGPLINYLISQRLVSSRSIISDVELSRKYQRISPLEHILCRPDSYIGSVIVCDSQQVYLFDEFSKKMIRRKICFVPGLLKIFDEILVNAADNKLRDPNMKCVRIDVNREDNIISVWNDGRGIPVEIHPVEGVYVPTLIFGSLFTSSNYDDNEIKIIGGRNGFGAKLCNIFSKEFKVETNSSHSHLKFSQIWKNNMTTTEGPLIESSDEKDFTRISFKPDLSKFSLSDLSENMVILMKKRAIDVAGTLNSVDVFFNGDKIMLSGFRDYVELFLNNYDHNTGKKGGNYSYRSVNDRWQVAVAISDDGFQQISFVNNIATPKGGRHVDYIVNQVVEKLKEEIDRRTNVFKSVRSEQIKNHLMIFINCLIENPAFDSQTKELLITSCSKFGSTCILPNSFFKEFFSKTEIIERLLLDIDKRRIKLLNQSKKSSLSDIVKLDDALYAGTNKSYLCTLIVTEGDSAKALAVAGLSTIGRDYYGVFPIRGKLINTRDLDEKLACENSEIAALIRILGLKFGEDYGNEGKRSHLRYGRLMLMTDQDPDGSHIKGLIINFIHTYWPSLIHSNFIQYFVTPLLKVFHHSGSLSFYSTKEYEDWKTACGNFRKYKVKYYKGLGTSSSQEGREYFSHINRHTVDLISDESTDKMIELVFDRNMSKQRKDWINNETKKIKTPLGFGQKEFVNEKTYTDFFNQDLIEFSCLDLKRSIPSVMDGLKPSQRKVLYTMMKRFDHGEIRVSQLAGAVAQFCEYHHGEESLVETVKKLAQNFVGSNNINLLLPIGQFGTRSLGGDDSASARYIYTGLNPITRIIFPPSDDSLLSYVKEDNSEVEPEWFCPIIPMILVNGAEGIGTGWATKILPHSPFDVIENIRRMIDGKNLQKMFPCYRNFTGRIEELTSDRYRITGTANLLSSNNKNFLKIEITELPIGIWTQKYKENVLEALKSSGLVKNYTESHNENSVHFLVEMINKNKLHCENKPSLSKMLSTLKLHNIQSSNMVVFNADNVLCKYSRVEDILSSFFDVNRSSYRYLLDMPLSSLCEEEICLLNDKKERKEIELKSLIAASWQTLWHNDLDNLSNVCFPLLFISM